MSIFNIFARKDINEGVRNFRESKNAILLDVRTREEYASGHIAQELTFLAELWEVGSPESGFTLHWERKATCLQWAGLGEGRWAPALRPGLHAHPGSGPQKAGAQALRSQGTLRLCPAVRREGDAHFQVSL